MRILFLHGWRSVVGGVKPTYLKDACHNVINPALDDDDFELAVRTAQTKYDKHKPDVIVGSSRGGAVALNIDSGDTPLVLLCPAWKKWGTATAIKPNSVIFHSRKDNVIPLSDSEELVANSGLPFETVIEVGNDHRLANAEPLKAMLAACERVVSGMLVRDIWIEMQMHGDIADAAAKMDLSDYFRASGNIRDVFNCHQESGERGLRKLLDTLLGCYDDWRICVHEAGHAIVAARLRIPLEKIARGGGTSGQVEPIHDPVDTSDQNKRADYQVFYAAGAAAERIVFSTETRRFDRLVDPLQNDKWQHERLKSQERTNAFKTDIEQAVACLGGVVGRTIIERVASLLKERRDEDGSVGHITQDEVADIAGIKLW